jgi:endonuclease/exonuclease/phosphatase (EEP) superfamily protein YafD
LIESESLQLSGVGFSGARFSLHLGEIRTALLAWIDHPDRGRILVVNTHLHHGFEATPALRELLNEAQEDGRVQASQMELLEIALAEARDRRLLELDRLLESVHRAERRRPVDAILLGGDLNSPPEGVVAKVLAANGWIDLHAVRGAAEPTWDATRNHANHRLQADFEFPLPTFGNPEMQKLYRAFDDRPRRIDYLWAKGALAHAPARAQLILDRPNAEGFCASDHFGVMVQWS